MTVRKSSTFINVDMMTLLIVNVFLFFSKCCIRKVVKRGRKLMVGYSGEGSEGNSSSSSSTEVAVVECKKRRRRQSRVIGSDGEVEKCLPGLENVVPLKLSSDEESEDVAIMSGPKTYLLRRTIHDRDSDLSSSTKPDPNKLIISTSPRLPLLKKMLSQKSKRLLKDGSVRSGDECDSGISLDEFIAGEEDSEVEEELEGSEEEGENSDDAIEEEDEGEVSINYMALTFQLQQNEDRRISGDVEMITFEKAFPQYLQFLCLALDPRLEAGQQGKTNGEKFMSRWPFDMHKPNLKHLAAATNKVESDIQYRMKNIQSGGWNASFVNSIQSYPTMEIKPYQKDTGYDCSACHREKYGAHILCILSGPFYDGASVWDSMRWDRYLPKGWDINGNAIKCFQGDTSENVEVEVGSTCSDKVRTA